MSGFRSGFKFESPLDIVLWPEDDREDGTGGRPRMTVIHPEGHAVGKLLPAFLVLRGDRYLECYGSGADAARFFAARVGLVGVEVEFRVAASKKNTDPQLIGTFPKPFYDVCRAMRLLRYRADELGIDKERIGVVGFGSGAHLAALLSTCPDRKPCPTDDLADVFSARPARAILAYPLLSFLTAAPGVAKASKRYFGKTDVEDARKAEQSPILHVDPSTPPSFLWTCADDDVFPSDDTLQYYLQLRAIRVPVELHLFDVPGGAHGVGMARDHPRLHAWMELAVEWLGDWVFPRDVPPEVGSRRRGGELAKHGAAEISRITNPSHASRK